MFCTNGIALPPRRRDSVRKKPAQERLLGLDEGVTGPAQQRHFIK